MTRNRHLILQRHYYPLAILLTLCLHSVAPATSPLNDIQWQIIQNLKDAIAQSGTPDANVDLNPALFPSSTNLDQAARFLLVPAVMEINGLTAIRFSVLDRILRLKLLDETLIWDESRPDEIVQRMMDTFSRIRDKAQRPDCIIVAVPPLLGRNLSFEWSFLERTLAVVIENALLAYENIIVLAWEDAAALGPAGTTLGSGPPAIVLSVAGSFFVSITNDQPMIHLNLQTRKGDVVVSEKEAQMAWAADLPVRLAAVMGRLLAEEPLPPSGKIDAVILCRDLGTRSRTHLQLGAWGLAHAISEYVVLLCPGDYDARVTALGALCELAGYGHHSDAAERGIPRSFFPRRLWAAETGLKHVAPLLYNEALGDVRWRTLSTFRQSTMMQHYDFTKDPDDLAERFRDYCARRAFLYQDYLERHAADAAWMAEKSPHWLNEVVYFADQEALVNPRAAVDRLHALFALLPDFPEAARLALRICVNASIYTRLTSGGTYDLILSPLETSSRRDFRAAAELARVFLAVKDRASRDDAVRRIDEVIQRESLSHADRMAFFELLNRCLTLRSIPLDANPLAEEPVQVPELTDISEAVRAAVSGAHLRQGEWITAGHEWDVLNTDRGIMAIHRGGETRCVFTQSVLRASASEGVIWALGTHHILAHDLQSGRTLVEILPDLDIDSLEGAVLCSAGRRAFIIGYNKSERAAIRTWYLRASMTGQHIDVQLIYDGRLQKDNARQYSEPRMAFQPEWSLLCPGKGDLSRDGAHVIVGRRYYTQPLVIDSDTDQVAMMPTAWPLFMEWPYLCSRAIEHDNRIYILSGQLHRGRQWSAVHVADEWSATPSILADFGLRSVQGFQRDSPPYYQSAVVFNGVLHLISRSAALAPQWSAVDLDTQTTYQLVTAFAGDDRDIRLINSPTWGLLVVKKDGIYKVTLPDQKTWPSYPPGPQDLVTFHIEAPQAHTVSIAGDFNGWKPNRLLLKKDTAGSWDARLRLPRGKYAYKLVVDGEWKLDPNNPATINVDGHENSLLVTAGTDGRNE